MTTSIKIDEALQTRVRQLADSRKRPSEWIMREAIEQYVEREEKHDAFKQEALQSWANYQATGRHLTGKETSDWLSAWGTDDEQPVPECHR